MVATPNLNPYLCFTSFLLLKAVVSSFNARQKTISLPIYSVLSAFISTITNFRVDLYGSIQLLKLLACKIFHIYARAHLFPNLRWSRDKLFLFPIGIASVLKENINKLSHEQINRRS